MNSESDMSQCPEAVPGRIRVAEPGDLPAIAHVHIVSFPGFFATLLGPGFLRSLYGLLIRSDHGIVLVAENAETITGFVAGALDPVRYYNMIAAKRWRFAFYALICFLRHPRLLSRIIWNVRRVTRPEPPSDMPSEACCELSAIGVHPDLQHKGLGRDLATEFVAVAQRRGAAKVYLTTDAEGNDAVNRFYSRLGFKLTSTFMTPGKRPMNEYSLILSREPEPHADEHDG